MLKHRNPCVVVQHFQKLLPNEDQFPREIDQLLPDALENQMSEKNHCKDFVDRVFPCSRLDGESFQGQVQSDQVKSRCNHETHGPNIRILIAMVDSSVRIEEDAVDVVACGREYDTKQVGFERAPRDVKSDEIPLLTVIGGIVGTGAIFGGHACCVLVTGLVGHTKGTKKLWTTSSTCVTVLSLNFEAIHFSQKSCSAHFCNRY